MQSVLLNFNRRVISVCVLAGLGFAVPAWAQPVSANAPNDAVGQHSRQLPQATLAASASADVDQDTITITLATQVSHETQQQVSAALSATLDSVIKQAKSETRVKTSSGNYRVWPSRNDKGEITGWQGRADVMLESSDFPAASILAGELSDRMAIANMQFSVSPQVRQKTEADLLNNAAQAFTARANAIAKAFGYEAFRIKSLALDGTGADYSPMPRMMMATAGAEKAAVPLEAGTETVTVSVRAEVYLLSGNK